MNVIKCEKCGGNAYGQNDGSYVCKNVSVVKTGKKLTVTLPDGSTRERAEEKRVVCGWTQAAPVPA